MQFEPTVRRLVDAPFSCREKVAAMESFPIAMDVQPPPQHTAHQFLGTARVPQPPKKSPLGVEGISPLTISTGPTAETYIPEAVRHLSTLTPEEHDEVMSGIAAQLLSAFQKKLSHQSEVIASIPTEDLLRIVLQHTNAQHPNSPTNNAVTHTAHTNKNTTNNTAPNVNGSTSDRRDTLKFVSPRVHPDMTSLSSPADIEAVVEGLTITEALTQDLHQSFTHRAVAGRRTSLRAPRRSQVTGTTGSSDVGSPMGGVTSIRGSFSGYKGSPQSTQPPTVDTSSPASPIYPGASSSIHQGIASSVSPRHGAPSTPMIKAAVPSPWQAPLDSALASATDPSMSGDLAGVRSDDSARGIASIDIGSGAEDAIYRRGLVYTIANVNTKHTKTRAQLQVEEEESALSQKVPKVAPVVVEYALDRGALEGLPSIQPRADGTIPVLSTRPEVLDLQIRREYVVSLNETAISASNEQLASVRTVLGDLKRVAAAEAQWQAEVHSREEQLSALEGQQAELRQILLSIQSALVATKAGKEIPEAITRSLAKPRPSTNTNPLQRFNTFVPHDSPSKKRSMLHVPGRGGSKTVMKTGGSFSRANRSVSQWGGATTKGASSPDPKRPESPEGEAGGAKDRRRELDPETRLLVALHGGGQQVDSCTYKLSSNVTRLITLGKQVATHVQRSQRSSTPAKDARHASSRASDSLSLSHSRARTRHESVVSMAAESEFGGMLDHLDAYSAVGEAMHKPLSEMTDDDLLKLALIKECEGELRALVGQRDRMRAQLEAGEEELVRIQGHLTTLTGPREGETRELAVELAHLLDRNRDSDADSSDFDDSDDDERPHTEGLVEAEDTGPTDSMLGLEHEPHNAAVQCDLGTGDPSDTDIGGANKDSVARFERLFRSERDLLNALRQLAVSVSHVLTFHWSMETELTCKCCLQVFRRPSTVWPCGHVVCQECLFRDVDDGEGMARCGECESYSEAGSSLNDVLDGLCRVHHTLPFVPGEEQPHESSTYAALVEAMSMADVSTTGLTRAASQLYRRASKIGDAPSHTTRDHLATLHELVRNAKERVDTMNEEAASSPEPSVRRKATQVKILPM